MPSWHELMNEGIRIRPRDVTGHRIPLFDFETLICPGLLLPVDRPGTVVPIQPCYADQLLPPTVSQTSMLPGQEAALRLERAYFLRSGSQRLLSRGTIVVFYLSDPRKEAAAVARATFSDTLSQDEAATTLSRQGVLAPDDIEGHADRRGRVTAFTFDSLTALGRAVPYGELKRLDCVGATNYVTAEALAPEQLLKIATAGARRSGS